MPNKILRVLFLYNGVFVLAGSLLGPLYALYVEKLDTGILPVSISWATFLASTTFFTYFISKMGDRLKHKRFLLIAGYLVRAFCWFFMALISNIEQLVLIQFILGIGEALGSPAFDTIFAEHLDTNKHIMDYSDWKVISNGILVLGTLAGGFIVSRFGFHYLLFGMSGLAIISFVGVLINPHVDLRNYTPEV
jgi:MFS family permease